jgi:hypothetical protein
LRLAISVFQNQMLLDNKPSYCLTTPDEDENTYLKPSLRGVQPFFG